MLFVPQGLASDSAVVLDRFVCEDSVHLDSLHLPSLDRHIPSLPGAVFGNINGEEDVGPHDEEDNDCVEGVVLHEEEDASDEDVKHHRKYLEAEILQEAVDG